MNDRKILVFAGSAACFTGCIGDFISLFILGPAYPGYSQLYDTMSSLGSSLSPVSDFISVWWIILGILMIIFAFGFRAAYSADGKNAKTVFWLLILYGLGEGLGSGLFKADRISGSYTTSFIIHDILGGAGVFALLILPVFTCEIKHLCQSPVFKWYSRITIILGTFFLVLFSFRFIGNETEFLVKYKGLWQRLFIIVYYIYLMTVAFKMSFQRIGN